MPRPVVKIPLTHAEISISFGPRVLACIEREVGMSSFELATHFKDPNRARYFDLGMKLIVGAIRSVHPEWTEEIIDERIPDGKFMDIASDIANAWASSISEAAGPVIEALNSPNPTTPEPAAVSSSAN